MAADARNDLEPEQIATRMFSTGFRGFDTEEVRAYLERVSKEIEVLRARQRDLEARAAAAEQRVSEPPELTEEQVAAALGEETARVLATAREAAKEIRAKAEDAAAKVAREASEEAERVRGEADELRRSAQSHHDEVVAAGREEAERATTAAREEAERVTTAALQDAERVTTSAREEAEAVTSAAREEAQTVTAGAHAEASRVREEAEAAATRMRAEAEEVLEARTAEAHAAAETVKEAAEHERARLREQAEADAALLRAEAETIRDGARTDAEAEIEAARQEGRELVAEAQRVRERVLKDLAKRRKAARQQLEQLRAGRERLLAAHEVVRQTLEEATRELTQSLPEARAAAELAGRRVEAEAEATMAELEAEIAAGRPEGEGAEGSASDEAHGAARSAAEHDQEPGDQARIAAPTAEEAVAAVPEPITADMTEPAEVATAQEEVEEVEERAEGSASDEAHGAARSEAERDQEHAEGSASDEHKPDADEIFARMRAASEESAEAAGDQERDQEIDLTGAEGGAAETTELPVVDVSVSEVETVTAAEEATEDELAVLALLERRDAATDDVEHSLARRLKRALADDQSEIMDTVRRARGVPGFDVVVPSIADHAARYAAVSLEDLQAAATAGAEFGGDATATVDVADLASALAEDLVSQIRSRLERCFADDALDEEELNNRLRATYREWKTQRIVELARHTVLDAFNRGQLAATPAGTQLRWVLDDGGHPCPDCDDDTLAGAVTVGDEYPTGHTHPPAHAGCRCLLVPATVAAATS